MRVTMFGFFKKSRIPSDLSKLTMKDIESLLKSNDSKEANLIIRRAADLGSVDSAVFISSVMMLEIDKKGASNTPKNIIDDFVLFSEIAAKKGDETTQFNLAKYYVSQSMKPDGGMDLEGYKFLKRAEHWYKKSCEKGFEPSAEALKRLQELFDWAHETFGTDEDSLEDDGENLSEVEIFGRKCARSICEQNNSLEIIRQLVLEDIEGASMGNAKAKAFAQSSGFSSKEYIGALKNSIPEVDGPEGIKTYLDEMAMKWMPDINKVADCRLAATDYIMRAYQLGKYS